MSLPRPVYAFPRNIFYSCADIPLQTIARKTSKLHHLLHVRILIFIHYATYHHRSLMQLVVILLGTADHRYLSYLWRRYLRLQEIQSNPPSFASVNFFASLLAQTHYGLVKKSNLVIHLMYVFSLVAFAVDSMIALQIPVTLPLPSSLSAQAATRFNHVGL
jgi:hypothetical protein